MIKTHELGKHLGIDVAKAFILNLSYAIVKSLGIVRRCLLWDPWVLFWTRRASRQNLENLI